MKQKLQIAVRELVEHVLRSGDLEHAFIGVSRAVEGIRAHQKIQRSRPDVYTPEITVSHQVETERFILEIGGRIDGVYRYPDSVIIDEIKTTVSELDRFEDKENQIHWGQAKCYAYLYALEFNLENIVIQLTYYRPDTEEIREFQRSFIVEELGAFFNDLIDRYLRWAEAITDWCRLRDESLKRFKFPFGAYRPGQREMAVDVYRTIQQGRQLMVQAATGIGKTMAVLFPAAKALGEGLTPKIFYLTARTTGKTAAEKALIEMRNQGARIKSLTLTAKEKICFDSEKACTPEECEFVAGYYDRIDSALTSIFTRDHFDRETVSAIALEHRVCPFEFSLELALWADCIVCDYNYAFDPRVYLRRFFLEEANRYTFLIDEAHNLVDRSRDMFSAELWKQPFLELRRVLKDDLPGVYKSMGRINSWMVKKRKACEAAGHALAEKEDPQDLYPFLQGFLRLTEKWLALNIKTPYRESLLDLYFKVNGFSRIAEQYDENYTTCSEKFHKDFRVKLFCVDPSGPLHEAFRRCASAVFFSATLSPMNYFLSILGCDPEAYQRLIPSPFPPQNQCVLIMENISTRYKHRETSKESVAAAIFSMVNQKMGNYLIFFPSYVYMKMVSEVFVSQYSHIDIICQTPESTEAERDRFLEQFSGESGKTLVGFVVMGGVFGEGIDLEGERLSGAAVVGVGLPAISMERELIKDYFSLHQGLGFEYAYIFPGMNRVLQAAGRVIRSEHDRGEILLIGERFTHSPYRHILPEEWDPGRVKHPQGIEEVLTSFWKK